MCGFVRLCVQALGIRDHAVMDEHVGGGGGVEVAKTMFERFPNYTMGAVNAETNAGIHTVSRMMMEAKDLLDWFNCAEVRPPASCDHAPWSRPPHNPQNTPLAPCTLTNHFRMQKPNCNALVRSMDGWLISK